MLQEMAALAEARGLAERFRFVGERDDVARLLPALDVFAMASRYEGLPCAVVEAMRCGLPVVATAVNSVPDLVVPGESGLLVPPGRPRLLAVAIDGLLDDPVAAARLASRGQALAGRPFDATGLAEVLDEVYAGALAANAAALAG
jgi:glycosyltransferase involved in cell wall biosynthesis